MSEYRDDKIDQTDQIDLIELIMTIWDGKFKVIGISLIFLLSMIGYNYVSPQITITATTEIKPITLSGKVKFSSVGYRAGVFANSILDTIKNTIAMRKEIIPFFLLLNIIIPSIEDIMKKSSFLYIWPYTIITKRIAMLVLIISKYFASACFLNLFSMREGKNKITSKKSRTAGIVSPKKKNKRE